MQFIEKKYEYVCEQLEEMLFDLDIEKKEMFFSPAFGKICGYSPEVVFRNGSFDHSYIHPDDYKKIKDMFRDIYKESECITVEFRVRKLDGGYMWCRMKFRSYFNSSNQLIRCIGIMSNIDELKRTDVLKDKQKSKTIERYKKLSQVDGLTGLFNKVVSERLCVEHLKKKEDRKLSVLFIVDVDNFKCINDSMGHQKGDEVLREFGKFLKSSFRKTDIVGRVGGDEFLVFMKDVRNIKDAEKHAIDICQRMSEIAVDINNVCLSCSIGIAGMRSVSGKTDPFAEMMRQADTALYHAKGSGKNQYQVYGKNR